MSKTQKTHRIIKLFELYNKTVAKKANFDSKPMLGSLVHFHSTEICTKRRFPNSDLLTFNKLEKFFPRNKPNVFSVPGKKSLQPMDVIFLEQFGGYTLYNYFQEGLQKNSFVVYENEASLELPLVLTGNFFKNNGSIPTFLDKQTCFRAQTGLFQNNLLIRLNSYNFSEKSMVKIKKSLPKSPVYYLSFGELRFKYLNRDMLKGTLALTEAFSLEAS